MIALSDFAPVSAGGDVAHGSLTNAVCRRRDTLRYAARKQKPDAAHLGVCKPRLPLLLPYRRPISALAFPIGRVIRIGSEKQMGYLDTKRVVATVENAKASWDGAVRPRPRETMGEYRPSSRLRELYRPVSAVSCPVSQMPCPFEAFPVATCTSIKPRPEFSGEVSGDRDMISGSHVDLRSGSLVRPGETLARLPGRSYFTRGGE